MADSIWAGRSRTRRPTPNKGSGPSRSFGAKHRESPRESRLLVGRGTNVQLFTRADKIAKNRRILGEIKFCEDMFTECHKNCLTFQSDTYIAYFLCKHAKPAI